MNAVEIIIKKRDGQELTKDEIQYFINGYTDDTIPDYQASAWAMAVLLNGMTDQETTELTLAMAASGDMLDLSGVVDIAVDKHSTGGVGDKTTIVVEPIVAACGLPVGKMSGRGLGFSGGTLDKMESIPGYRTDLSTDEFLTQLGDLGLVLTGQTGDLAPADGKLYGLRDTTGTVQSIPLIASSVMSKKIAAGAQAIVLDVKVGNGAFMETFEDAKALSNLMVSIAKLANRKAVALISDMNQPLGQAVGNSLELTEAIDTLQGGGPADFVEHCIVVASHMLVIGDVVEEIEQARTIASEVISNGYALQKFYDLVEAQGGDLSYAEEPARFPSAPYSKIVKSQDVGYIEHINARKIGETSVLLGAGRIKKSDHIDHSVGVEVFMNVGDEVEIGQPLFKVHAKNQTDMLLGEKQVLSAFEITDHPIPPLPLFYDVIS